MELLKASAVQTSLSDSDDEEIAVLSVFAHDRILIPNCASPGGQVGRLATIVEGFLPFRGEASEFQGVHSRLGAGLHHPVVDTLVAVAGVFPVIPYPSSVPLWLINCRCWIIRRSVRLWILTSRRGRREGSWNRSLRVLNTRGCGWLCVGLG